MRPQQLARCRDIETQASVGETLVVAGAEPCGPRPVLDEQLRDLGRAPSKRELVQCIDDYRRGLVPLVVPVTLLRHHVRVHDVTYLAGQVYLEPHPRELMLRNHV